MENYVDEKGCLSKYVVNSLNDDTAYECGKCANCLGHGILEKMRMSDQKEVTEIQQRMGSIYIAIEPRKRWQIQNDLDSNLSISVPNEIGIALAKYGEAGYGEMVAYDKYHEEEFREELVNKAVDVLREKLKGQGYTAVTNVPSTRNKKVEKFAVKVAQGLGMDYIDLLDKVSGNAPQKKMQNSYYQCKNVLETMMLKKDVEVPQNIILIDDMVDSKWTLTVCGRILTHAGAVRVFPFCLADSSIRGDLS